MAPRIDSTGKKSLGPGPGGYDIPSKMVEKPGKSMGTRLQSSLDGKSNLFPGPGTYEGEKLKSDDFKFTIGTRIDAAKSKFNVPGPGTYERYKEETIGTKFSKDARQSMEAKGLKG